MEARNSNPINFDHLSELQQQLGSQSAIVLINRFKLELEALISKISNFEKDQDEFETLIGSIHKSAGSAAALGISGVQQQLNIMETMAKTGNATGVFNELSRLMEIWQAAKAALTIKSLMQP